MKTKGKMKNIVQAITMRRLMVLVSLTCVSSGHAADLVVGSSSFTIAEETCTRDDTNPNPISCTLNAAINAAVDGDTIRFSQALQGGAIAFGDNTLSVNKNLTISGDPLGVTLNGMISNELSGGALVIIEMGHTVTLRYLTIQGRKCEGINGCGISNFGTLMLAYSRVTGNHYTGGDFGGGGIGHYYLGSLTIDHSSIDHNTCIDGSFGYGGGIFIYGSATPIVLRNSTIAYNSAVGGEGGGIYAQAPLNLEHSTLAYNQASSGVGGGISTTSTLSLFNSIIAGNTADFYGDIIAYTPNSAISKGYNLVGNSTSYVDDSSITVQTHDIFGSTGNLADPKFVDTQGVSTNYGGYTPTLALQAMSPVLGNGNCAEVTGNDPIPAAATDQRDYSRPTTLCDSGAFEETIFRGTFD